MNTPVASQALADWHGVDREIFETQIVPRAEPAVLRGLVAHWPAAGLAQRSASALCEHLATLDSGHEVDALMVPPGRGGRIFYSDDGSSFNYLRQRLPISRVIEQLLRYAHFPDPPAVAVQSALVSDCAPGWLLDQQLPLLDARVAPRLWLGNRVVTPTHFDESSNIACVVAGERRFTLFPPDQVGNLYIGPLDHAPTGTPISLVDLAAPDLHRFPRFASALQASRCAVLQPGDAIYIPPLWWHHVASLQPLNLLINYWWSDAGLPSGLGTLTQAMSAFGSMPAPQRLAWQALLAHWVFEADADTHAHIPPTMRRL